MHSIKLWQRWWRLTLYHFLHKEYRFPVRPAGETKKCNSGGYGNKCRENGLRSLLAMAKKRKGKVQCLKFQVSGFRFKVCLPAGRFKVGGQKLRDYLYGMRYFWRSHIREPIIPKVAGSQERGECAAEDRWGVLQTILRRDITVIGCGRTDAGVHAEQFYLHFETDKTVEGDELEIPGKFLCCRDEHLCRPTSPWKDPSDTEKHMPDSDGCHHTGVANKYRFIRKKKCVPKTGCCNTGILEIWMEIAKRLEIIKNMMIFLRFAK